MALMKMVSSRMYEFLESSLASGQKRGQPLAMFISLTGRWKEEEEMSGRKASMMCSRLFWSSSIRVTWVTFTLLIQGEIVSQSKTKEKEKER